MDQKTKARMEARAAILKAMAHPTRLFIVDQLSRKRLCVAELTALIQADMSTVSKHLSLLKNVGIVQGHKQGTQVFYQLSTPCVLDFFTCLESILQNRVQSHLEVMGK